MTPIDQDRFFDAAENRAGNCVQAAVASVLGKALTGVPDFMHDPERFWDTYADFIDRQNLSILQISADQAAFLENYYLAFGPAERGCGHTVVYYRGALAHDPHPSRAGLQGVQFVHVFVPKAPRI